MKKKKTIKPAGPSEKEISKKAPKKNGGYPDPKGGNQQLRETKTWNPSRIGTRHDDN